MQKPKVKLNLKDNYIEIKEFISEYYWIAGIPFLIWGLILVMEKKEDINHNHTETYGMVYGSVPIYKKYSKRNYKYEFIVNGKKYTGTSSAYDSKNVKKGGFYVVEFSYKNPKNSRMIFDMEYVREIMTNEKGELDTIYVPKDQKFRNEMKERIKKFKIELDSINN